MADTKLTAEESYNVLVAQVHAPVFFNKLASDYGIKPETPEEARELLLMAGQLRNAHEQDNTKQAGARTGFYTEARQNLNNALAQYGYQPIMEEEDTQTKQAAAEAIQNPLVKEAAIVFSNYMAQALQAQ